MCVGGGGVATVILLISKGSEAVYPSACTVPHLQAGGSVKGGECCVPPPPPPREGGLGVMLSETKLHNLHLIL